MAESMGPRLRRTWPQRLLISFNVGLILVCVLAAGGIGYFYYQFGQLPRLALANLDAPPEDPGDPQNFLLVGSDSRAFVEDDRGAESFGDPSMVPGERADTIMVVRVDPRNEKASMLSLPRDLLVTVHDENGVPGRQDRINAAFENGPEGLIATIQGNFDIPIHHYAQVDFAGFKRLVDAVGGVEMYFAAPVRDWGGTPTRNLSGLDIPEAGCITLDGAQALGLVRSRHYQEYVDGRWRADPSGDHGRIERQQDFIRRAIREALSKGLTNPRRLNELVQVAIENVDIDDALDGRAVLSLGRRFSTLDPASVETFTLPVRDARTSAGAAVLRLIEDEAQMVFDVFRGLDPGEVRPSGVQVRVLNGSGIAGQAGEVRDALQLVQFGVTPVGNAPANVERTVMRFGAGQLGKAQLLARYLATNPELVEDPSLVGVDVVLTTGADFEGVLPGPRPAAEAPEPAEPPTAAPGEGGEPAPAEEEPPPDPGPEC